jgi:hypothetical protein
MRIACLRYGIMPDTKTTRASEMNAIVMDKRRPLPKRNPITKLEEVDKKASPIEIQYKKETPLYGDS